MHTPIEKLWKMVTLVADNLDQLADFLGVYK